MKRNINTVITTLLLAAALFGSQLLLAHNELKGTTPADGVELARSPGHIALEFADEAYLEVFELLAADGTPVVLDYSPPVDLASYFSIPLPQLADGEYTVKWTVEGSDTHRLSGEFTFSLVSDGA